MRYAILGTTQASHDDGTTVAVGGARLRALLTALALRPGRAVPAALLVGEVWDADPPAEAVPALQALVGRLRRALGHAAVRSGPGGYLLDARREDVDAFRFERLVRAAADAPDPAGAAALYDEALALWRGPALASLPEAAAEAARWEAVRMDARRGRLGAALALGEAEAALPELAELCARQPLDEPLQVLRIRALRAAGRPAQALAAYEAVRRDLSARLGTDPGPQLRSLHAELLDPAPAPAPGSVREAEASAPSGAAPASGRTPWPLHPAAAHQAAGHPAAVNPAAAHPAAVDPPVKAEGVPDPDQSTAAAHPAAAHPAAAHPAVPETAAAVRGESSRGPARGTGESVPAPPSALADAPRLTLLLPGGQPRRGELSLTGPLTE
ncbi:BTAD domain-containing putative transcriptional regulator, partial [Streptomyces sp. NPDC004667]|uniref:AfsR/SARP family transcriptional regulator n=1 Tax=Streptomyces sp. NPDC004667 TaxID=3154285 RepID=UPI0033BD27B3